MFVLFFQCFQFSGHSWGLKGLSFLLNIVDCTLMIRQFLINTLQYKWFIESLKNITFLYQKDEKHETYSIQGNLLCSVEVELSFLAVCS